VLAVNKMLASRDITFGPDGRVQAETLFFPAGAAGAKGISFGIDPLPREENLANNSVTRPLFVSDTKRKILYIEGEPRWEFKFIRRAEDDDPSVQIVSMLRTSENKIYRQGIANPDELANGFPVRPEDLLDIPASLSGQWMRITSLLCSRNCCANMSTGAAAAFSSSAAVHRSVMAAGPRRACANCCPRRCLRGATIFIATRLPWS